MKRNSYLILLVFFFALVKGHAQTEEHFGKKITEEGAISPEELVKILENKESVAVKVKGPIIESCKNKGCWMDMKLADGKVMKIKFKDYAFFVPKGISNKIAVVDGVVKKEILSVKALRHYAKDAGKSDAEIQAIKAPEENITFEAEGVILK